MSKKNSLTIEEQMARVRAIRNRVIDERLGFAPRGVPKRLLQAMIKDESIAAMYPTIMGNWLFAADDGGSGGKTELTHEAFIAVLVWRLETERVFGEVLEGEGL